MVALCESLNQRWLPGVWAGHLSRRCCHEISDGAGSGKKMPHRCWHDHGSELSVALIAKRARWTIGYRVCTSGDLHWSSLHFICCASVAAHVRGCVALSWAHKILKCRVKTLHIPDPPSHCVPTCHSLWPSTASLPCKGSTEITFVEFFELLILGMLKHKRFASVAPQVWRRCLMLCNHTEGNGGVNNAITCFYFKCNNNVHSFYL